ncbi:MAG: ABC transporter permease [Bacilli bacterium]
MLNLFILNLKKLFKNKIIIFWCLVFPIILGTIFHVVFEDIKNKDDFESIQVNYVLKADTPDNALANTHLTNLVAIMESEDMTYGVKTEDDNEIVTEQVPIFLVFAKSLSEAEQELADEQVMYIEAEKESAYQVKFKIYSTNENINFKILSSVVTTYADTANLIQKLVMEGEMSPAEAQALCKENAQNSFVLPSGNKMLDYVNNYHYTVIAMAIIFGAFLAFEQAKIFQPMNFAYAKRVKVSGVSRPHLLLSSILSALVVQLAIMAIYLMVCTFIFQIHLTNFFLALLVIFLGIVSMNVLGFFLGIFFNKFSQNAATALIVILGTLGGFLAGMMVPIIKHYVNIYLPFIAYTNINGLLSDSFLQLDFGNYTQYWYNIFALSLLTVVLAGMTFYKYVKKEK